MASHESGKPTTSAVAAAPGDPRTPTGVVTAYYEALGDHRFDFADSLIASASRPGLTGSPDSPNRNLDALTRLTVSAARNITSHDRPGLPIGLSISDYNAFAQVTVDYNATFRPVITAHSGPQTEFLYVGRQAAANLWQILSIGSGP